MNIIINVILAIVILLLAVDFYMDKLWPAPFIRLTPYGKYMLLPATIVIIVLCVVQIIIGIYQLVIFLI